MERRERESAELHLTFPHRTFPSHFTDRAYSSHIHIYIHVQYRREPTHTHAHTHTTNPRHLRGGLQRSVSTGSPTQRDDAVVQQTPASPPSPNISPNTAAWWVPGLVKLHFLALLRLQHCLRHDHSTALVPRMSLRSSPNFEGGDSGNDGVAPSLPRLWGQDPRPLHSVRVASLARRRSHQRS